MKCEKCKKQLTQLEKKAYFGLCEKCIKQNTKPNDRHK